MSAEWLNGGSAVSAVGDNNKTLQSMLAAGSNGWYHAYYDEQIQSTSIMMLSMSTLELESDRVRQLISLQQQLQQQTTATSLGCGDSSAITTTTLSVKNSPDLKSGIFVDGDIDIESGGNGSWKTNASYYLEQSAYYNLRSNINNNISTDSTTTGLTTTLSSAENGVALSAAATAVNKLPSTTTTIPTDGATKSPEPMFQKDTALLSDESLLQHSKLFSNHDYIRHEIHAQVRYTLCWHYCSVTVIL